MKRIAPEDLSEFFTSLSLRYDLRIPILLADGGRAIGNLADGPLAMIGRAVLSKPTSFFFAQDELVFTERDGDLHSPSKNGNNLLVVGFTPRDLLCLHFIDRFFATGERDDLYFHQRDGAVVAVVSGYCGPDGAFIVPSYGGCDLEFIYDGNKEWLVLPYSEAGREIVSSLEDAPEELLEGIRKIDSGMLSAEKELIGQASRIMRQMELPDSFWEEIGERCIQCTGCNLVCPTCTCFGIQDWRYAEHTERRRMWDSCQLGGFMQEAGGHNPLGTAALRTRRRIHHKLAADPERWGEISCFVCGRCDATCPTGIGIFAISREIVARFAHISVTR